MVIVGYKQLAPLCQQTKVKLNGKSYKRLQFGKTKPTVQWMRNGEYLRPDKEKILEKTLYLSIPHHLMSLKY